MASASDELTMQVKRNDPLPSFDGSDPKGLSDFLYKIKGTMYMKFTSSDALDLFNPSLSSSRLGGLKSENFFLHSLLGLYTKGMALELVKTVEFGNGHAAVRLLTAKYCKRGDEHITELFKDLTRLPFESPLQLQLAVTRLVQSLTESGYQITSDRTIPLPLIRGIVMGLMPAEFNDLVFEQSRNTSESLDQLFDATTHFYDARKARNEAVAGTAVALSMQVQQGCSHCGKTNHKSSECFTKFPHLLEQYKKGKKGKGKGKVSLQTNADTTAVPAQLQRIKQSTKSPTQAHLAVELVSDPNGYSI